MDKIERLKQVKETTPNGNLRAEIEKKIEAIKQNKPVQK